MADIVDVIRPRSTGRSCVMIDAEKLHQAADEIERLRAALKPSADTKAAYMGEFHVPLSDIDEDGNEVMRRINVPWTTIKEIMAAIRDFAASDKRDNGNG